MRIDPQLTATDLQVWERACPNASQLSADPLWEILWFWGSPQNRF